MRHFEELFGIILVNPDHNALICCFDLPYVACLKLLHLSRVLLGYVANFLGVYLTSQHCLELNLSNEGAEILAVFNDTEKFEAFAK